MYSLDDTIAAISTAEGRGGVGIVRLSGPAALAVATALFRPSRELARRPRRLCYGHVLDPDSGDVVDEVLAVYMPAPATYTRQDVVEIDAHGGPLAVRHVLSLCLRAGARPAEPGEYTLRAFVNGRIDLTQAEAVRDVVGARSRAALRQATRQLSGGLGKGVRRLRQAMLEALATLEVSMDFDDEDRPPPDVRTALRPVLADLERLLQTAGAGIARREGLRVAIVGRPNVGKSSLMNALLRDDRAIVAPLPGTTRDTVEESATIGGVGLVFVDTAGLAAASADRIETLGMERTKRALDHADIALLVLDASRPLDPDDELAAGHACRAPRVLTVWNKCDLAVPGEPSPVAGSDEARVSALTGQGLDELEAVLLRTILGGDEPSDGATIVSERQRDAVARAAAAVERVLAADGATPVDCLAMDLTEAVDALGEITGESAGDDLLLRIFSSFCVGK